eukprot:CAMPEP_0117648356 /NCGR_PEP_ID=MMETSP0804-20121206/355_1 /TAXON_ID=1074897 /ORGANISM="Tetraselmis astigmatica, Strain CCMP880" /LENGTH=172 /DNA_ID=CAMNT_0005453941 /DNA_START=123 /DNA_END=641 /DNA_ORIENTATION=-
MGCYFGCGTGGNRCSWASYAILLLTGAACLVAFGILAVHCGAKVTACGQESGLTAPSSHGTDYIWDSQNSDFAYQTCAALYPGNATAISLCVVCAELGQECAAPPLWCFIAGIVLLAFCWIPCFYFCCCANRPQPKEPTYAAQAPHGTYTSSAPPPPGTYTSNAPQPSAAKV